MAQPDLTNVMMRIQEEERIRQMGLQNQLAAQLARPTPSANSFGVYFTQPDTKDNALAAQAGGVPQGGWLSNPANLDMLIQMLAAGAQGFAGKGNPTVDALAGGAGVAGQAAASRRTDAMERLRASALDPSTSVKMGMDANGVTIKGTPEELSAALGGAPSATARSGATVRSPTSARRV